MGDERETNHPGGATPSRREREATSDETLDDLERTQDATVPTTGGGAASDPAPTRAETDAPSPDGAFDEPRGGRGDAGEPM